MTGRIGTTVAETLMTLVIGLLLVSLALRAVAAARTTQASMVERSERLTTLRVARSVLRTELRAGLPTRDWRLRSSTVLELRSFHGSAAVCGAGGAAGVLVVSWSGRRAPDPVRDSILALHPSGAWETARLVKRGGAGQCPGTPSPGEVWTTTLLPGAPPAFVFLYTAGDYHVSGGALRYRRGRAGRQPLTPTVLAPSSAFEPAGTSLWLQLAGATGWMWRGSLAYGVTP